MEQAEMNESVIIGAVRTPTGKFRGTLHPLSAPNLGALVIREVVARANMDPTLVDECIMGNVVSAGLGQNPARQAALAGGLSEHVSAMTINKVCGSGLKAVALGANVITSGEATLVLAGGVESMSQAPHYATEVRGDQKFGDSTMRDAIIADGLSDPVLKRDMGDIAEELSKDYPIGRDEQDEFALRSQLRAREARKGFVREIAKVGNVQTDEHPRPDTTLEKLQSLTPAFDKTGTILSLIHILTLPTNREV